MFVVANRRRLSDDAAEQIRRLIDEREIRPGERLPPERELARMLCVGRTSVREGLRTLDMMGLIEVVPGKGVFRKAGIAGPLDNVIRSWLSTHKGDLRDLVELREAVETQAASLAAQRAAPEDVAAMERALRVMRLATDDNDAERFVGADTAFHDAIARAGGNRLLRRALESIAREIGTFRMATARLGAAMLERSLADHEAVCRAIKAGDPVAARRAMRQHIVGTPMAFNVLDGTPPAARIALAGED